MTGIHPRVILDWTQREYLRPGAEENRGQGRTSYYSPANCVQAKVLRRLSGAGISLSKFSNVFASGPHSNLDERLFDPFKPFKGKTGYALVIIDQSLRVCFWNPQTEALPAALANRDYGTYLIVELEKIKEEVRAALEGF